ncbi:flagellar protein FlaG [bacterium 1xD8-48]|jgi:flagellar protein FlaG|nr:flagellar protein FlaG [Lachnospiraceae bacterium]MCI9324844.1 flagellar protein FlaG [Lachnospiraceae bacterium]NBJ97965.1 flagellar protein FlaG [bacterium 1xD8-48]
MAIEPLNSVMTFQAQTTQPVRRAERPEVENMDVPTQEQPASYDATTVKVANVEKQDSQSGQESSYSNNGRDQLANDQIRKAVEKLNERMSHSEAVFGIHEKTNRLTIKIVDKETKEVIKELPPEKTLDMIAKAWELAGLLVDERR